MPIFIHKLMVIGPLCDKFYSFIYNNSAVTLLIPTREVLIRIWKKTTGARL